MKKNKVDINIRQTDDGNFIVRTTKEIRNKKGFVDYYTEERVVVGDNAKALMSIVNQKVKNKTKKRKSSTKKKKKK